MSLKGYVSPTRNIEVPGNEDIVVRGLSLADIARIMRMYKDDIEPVFAKIQGQDGEQAVRNFDIQTLGTFLMQSAPGLVAYMIALAADEPDEVENVSRLPANVQLDLIQAVGSLTFEGEGGAKKVLQTVTRMFVGARGLAIGNAQP